MQWLQMFFAQISADTSTGHQPLAGAPPAAAAGTMPGAPPATAPPGQAAWEQHMRSEGSSVWEAFGTQTASIVQSTCEACQFPTSVSFEHSFEIQLGLPLQTGQVELDSAAVDIRSLLASHFGKESLAGAEAVMCSGCEVKKPASKQLRLERSSDEVVVQLKRFTVEFDADLRPVTIKVDRNVTFPCGEEELDLGPYMAAQVEEVEDSAGGGAAGGAAGGSGGGMVGGAQPAQAAAAAAGGGEGAPPPPAARGARFRLYAVVSHCGSMTSGHYICHFRNFRNREAAEWYCANDEGVTPCSAGAAGTRNAYLLFYRKV
jgi:ubiquitin C-terminal hydrolase